MRKKLVIALIIVFVCLLPVIYFYTVTATKPVNAVVIEAPATKPR
jgi:uncharacterized MnhB-related membrane protein